jgi:hypothetical protein
VYNVAHSVLKANYADQPPFRLFEVHTASKDDQSVTPIGESGWGRRSTDRPVPEKSSVPKKA